MGQAAAGIERAERQGEQGEQKDRGEGPHSPSIEWLPGGEFRRTESKGEKLIRASLIDLRAREIPNGTTDPAAKIKKLSQFRRRQPFSRYCEEPKEADAHQFELGGFEQ